MGTLGEGADETAPSVLEYGLEPGLTAASFIDLLERSGLAARRPVADRPRIERMLRQADLIVTARAGGHLVGVARAITDFAFCCYLSDLAVDRAWQGRGIGRQLMRLTRDAASGTTAGGTPASETAASETGADGAAAGAGQPVRCLLLSAPAARSYYPHVGLAPLDNAFDFTSL
ncbi:GNAT family N-acetyltransferase [Oleisolibacter albus]|uniref:GNAT family N-acetyltransferase n=1 Tax=Oleisolibacter albus TaxID=2171757 RepID=UPI000DF4911E|nr:GNAT family N-acetyltransferase [Oleisolibacter albus]